MSEISSRGEKTYLDIFKYYMNSNNTFNAPKELFIFNLPSVYPSQLKILLKMSKYIDIHWYYSPISEGYYGDLLSPLARIKLEKKIMGYPNLNIDDLYLIDGNPLVADLGGQSREFIELLLNNGIEIDFLNNNNPNNFPKTMLDIIKDDILKIKYRLDSQLRLNKNSDFYADPINISDKSTIKINICYNKMREVQVMFNTIADILNQDNSLKLNDILITAPNIDDYATYIEAVFNNEYVESVFLEQKKIPYTINGVKKYTKISIFESIELLFSVPYHTPITFLITVISDTNIMKNLQLSNQDIELITMWASENNVHFGYAKDDYHKLGYQDNDIYSLKRFIINLTYGLFIPNEISKKANYLPIITLDDTYVPYDNLEFSDTELLNKLVKIIDIIISIRDFLYIDEVTVTTRDLNDFKTLLIDIKESIFSIEQDQFYLDELIASINESNLPINRLIILNMINEFGKTSKTNSLFSGNLQFSSMQDVRGVPFKVVYIMGMENGKFPRIHTPNKLSILSNYWYIADRNYNLEDKQNFLELVMMAKSKLIISYVGINEKNNNNLDPNPMLNLFFEVIANSFGKDSLDSIMTKHSLHPFYNNLSRNYSGYWKQLSGKVTNSTFRNKWSFNHPINSSNDELNICADVLIKTLLYTNCNLYHKLQISSYKNLEVCDDESFEFSNRNISKLMFKELQKLNLNSQLILKLKTQIIEYMSSKGIVSSGKFGKDQSLSYLKVFDIFLQYNNHKDIVIEYINQELNIQITQKYSLASNGILYIFNDLNNIRDEFHKESYDAAMYAKILVYWSLINHPKTIIYDEQRNIIAKPKIIVNLINLKGEIQELEFGMNCTSEVLLNKIINYYINSLNHPTLFHKKAIQSYDKSKKPQQIYQELLKTYNNYDLEKLKSDPIWSSLINNYESLLDNPNFTNPLLNLVEIFNSIIIF